MSHNFSTNAQHRGLCFTVTWPWPDYISTKRIGTDWPFITKHVSRIWAHCYMYGHWTVWSLRWISSSSSSSSFIHVKSAQLRLFINAMSKDKKAKKFTHRTFHITHIIINNRKTRIIGKLVSLNFAMHVKVKAMALTLQVTLQGNFK